MIATKPRRRARRPCLAGLSALLVLAACGGGRPPADIEHAVLASDWPAVETATAAWVERVGFSRVATVLRGYAALARGDGAAAAAHFLRGRLLTESRADLSWAEDLAEVHPSHASAQLLAADALARRGEWRAAVERLGAALSHDPSLAAARLLRATLRAVYGEPAAAVADLEGLMHGPAAAEAALVRALVQLEAGEIEQAAADIDQALVLAPKHPVAMYTRGVLRSRSSDWPGAAHDFEAAFDLLPELEEARSSWQLARAAQERGATISGEWHIGIFGTGINAEADLKYATSHATQLLQGRPQNQLYVAIEGRFPLAGVEKARAQGIPTVVVSPNDPAPGLKKIDQFIQSSVAQGHNPIVFIDVNKVIPTQLGNRKPEAIELPAQIAVHAKESFATEVARTGAPMLPKATGAFHSDGTLVGARAAEIATQRNTPFTNMVMESPRLETVLDRTVRGSPATQFTVVQPRSGDFWTREAQRDFLIGKPCGYQRSMERISGIDAPNYRAVIIENPSKGILGLPAAHGDPANYERFTQATIWSGGREIARDAGQLGGIVGRATTVAPSGIRTDQAVTTGLLSTGPRGGILIGPVTLVHGSAGRVRFESGDDGREIGLVFTLFGRAPVAVNSPGLVADRSGLSEWAVSRLHE